MVWHGHWSPDRLSYFFFIHSSSHRISLSIILRRSLSHILSHSFTLSRNLSHSLQSSHFPFSGTKIQTTLAQLSRSYSICLKFYLYIPTGDKSFETSNNRQRSFVPNAHDMNRWSVISILARCQQQHLSSTILSSKQEDKKSDLFGWRKISEFFLLQWQFD